MPKYRLEIKYDSSTDPKFHASLVNKGFGQYGEGIGWDWKLTPREDYGRNVYYYIECDELEILQLKFEYPRIIDIREIA